MQFPSVLKAGVVALFALVGCSTGGGNTDEPAKTSCDNDPCGNGAVCTPVGITFECECPAGFSGELCLTNDDDCAANPCRNGGTCTDGIDSYVCTCLDGYTGSRCETVLDRCASQPCANGGSCSATADGFSCECPVGYTGDTCADDVDECAAAENPCRNGGTCRNISGTFGCDCATGFGGATCAVTIDHCASRPCENGGICTSLSNGFTCFCSEGFSGDTCSTNRDDCADNPCQNGGSCKDLVNTFECVCPTGFEGEQCETNINDCVGNPCLNGGTCEDAVDGFVCTCVPGFVGFDCGQNVNDCPSEDPCVHGTCVDGVQDFSCDCAPGWGGEWCDIDVDECADGSAACAEDQYCVNETPGFACEPVVFVDPAAESDGDGSTWGTAFARVMSAVASGAKEIWVKGGEQGPAAANAVVVTLPAGVRLYGGFDAELTAREGSRDGRDLPAMATRLTGRFDEEDDHRSAHVVVVEGDDVVVDGFHISEGQAIGEGEASIGGGLKALGVEGLVLRNIVFWENDAFVGGAVGIADSSVSLVDCHAEQNDSTVAGGAMAFMHSDVLINGGRIAGNVTGTWQLEDSSGGGLYFVGGTALVDGVDLDLNVVSGDGVVRGGGLAALHTDLKLMNMTVGDNDCVGQHGNPASSCEGGGVHYRGTLMRPWSDVGFVGNEAVGGDGIGNGGDGGSARGGGLFFDGVAQGAWQNVWFDSNLADAGDGARGQNGYAYPTYCYPPGSGGDGGHAQGGGLMLTEGSHLEIEGGSATGNEARKGFLGAAGTGPLCGPFPMNGWPGSEAGGAFYVEGATLVHDFTDTLDNEPELQRPCPAGFEGYSCDVDVDDCEGSPCGDHGSCTDGPGGYTCACANGWVGGRCQIDTVVGGCGGVTCATDEACVGGGEGVCVPAVMVDPLATGNNDGSTWEDAFTSLEAGLEAGSVVWVKALTWVLDSPVGLRPHQQVYGGFAPALVGRAGTVASRFSSQYPILDGNQLRRVVVMGQGSRLDGFVIQNGRSAEGAGIVVSNKAGVQLANLTLQGNRTVGGGARGAGLLCRDTVGLEISDVEFSDNRGDSATHASGGAAYFERCEGLLQDVTFENNRVDSTGGIAEGGALSIVDGDMVLRRVTLTSNAATAGAGRAGDGSPAWTFAAPVGEAGGNGWLARGGAVYLAGTATAPWEDVTITFNQVVGGAGGAGGAGEDRLAPGNATFLNCGAGGAGGDGGRGMGAGVFVAAGGSLNAEGGTISGNTAVGGVPGVGGPGGEDGACSDGDEGAAGTSEGGGVYAVGAEVSLDFNPLSNTPDNIVQ